MINRPLTETRLTLGPRERKNYTLDYGNYRFDPTKEYFVKIQSCSPKSSRGPTRATCKWKNSSP